MQVIFHKSGLFDEMRCSLVEEGTRPDPFDPNFQNDVNPATGKIGIRHYSPIVALFWRILNTISLGNIDKVEVIDSQKGKVYLDKESYNEWKNWKKIDGSEGGKTQEVASNVFQQQSPKINVDLQTKAELIQEKDTCIKEYNEKMKEHSDRVTEAINNDDPAGLKLLNEESLKILEAQEKRLSEINKKIEQRSSDQTPNGENGTPIVPISPSKPSNSPYPIYQRMLKDLGIGSPVFNEIFAVFFSKFNPSVLKSWKKEGTYTYSGTLKKTIKLWVPQGAKDDPKGGIIIMIGNNDEHKITLSLDPKNRSIKVSNGLNLCCHTDIGITDRICLVEFSHVENNFIKTEAGVKVPILGFVTKEKRTSKENLIKSWNNGEALKDFENHEEFLAKKINQLQNGKK